MKAMKTESLKDTDFIFLKVKNLWTHFKTESFAFKCLCCYLFVEYFRPQEIFKAIDILPWGQLFIILSLLSMFFDKKSQFKFTINHFLIFVFFAVLNFSILTAYDYTWSLEYYISFFQWVVVFVLIASIVSTKERFYIFFMVFFFCCLKIAVGTSKNWAMRGFSFTAWGLQGPSGYFENSGELAVLMLILFPIGFYFYRSYKNDVRIWEKYILLAATICPMMTILGSSSRGAQIALVIQLVVMFWRKVFSPKVLISIAIVGWVGWQVLPAEQKERFTTIGEDKSSIQRTLYWEHGWEMMKEYPLLGVGYYNFRPYYQDHYPEDVLYSYAQLPHNIFIQVGTDAGFTGALLFLSIILTGIFRRKSKIWEEDNNASAYYESAWKGLKVGIIGFLIAGQFVTIGYYPFLWISLALQTALLNAMSNKVINKEKQFKGAQSNVASR